MLHRARQAYQGATPMLEGPVEIDEAFVGGKEQNKQKEQITPACRGTHPANNRDNPDLSGNTSC